MENFREVFQEKHSFSIENLRLYKEEIMEEVVDCFAERLTRLAYTYVKDWGKAEDIVQDVFITCYSKLETFRGEGSLKNWLYRITVNRCKDHLKSWSHRNVWFANPVTFFKQESNEHTPELRLIVEDEYNELAESILSLPVKYRELIILYYQEELSLAEISELFKIKPSTLKSRLFQARKLLRTQLEKGAEPNG
ncbi:sigma-70 family RNA polymerase sigma factor [Pseudalkalibacillus berkeleyi]|uniref:Sigma-70 family RNA polymerase sigma factor n=1 Tax=Pseudalkalibacillus berkeleyi TaxID=1069813 RepID=A0ABS9H6S5_9BACL|nr:sigma-70 family RNA polymerase sigma factor [Pseudalkalibacillus berkeleyi]MCF6139626.1 sigma-70 family RNA polymerase sigma factor [Pseudalkalibacillus berkeleyi]